MNGVNDAGRLLRGRGIICWRVRLFRPERAQPRKYFRLILAIQPGSGVYGRGGGTGGARVSSAAKGIRATFLL